MDDNLIYGMVMAIVRLWWEIIKAVVFVVVYFLRQRPQTLAGPQTAQIAAGAEAEKSPLTTTELSTSRLTGTFFAVTGCVFVGLSVTQRDTAYGLLLIGAALIIVGAYSLRREPQTAAAENPASRAAPSAPEPVLQPAEAAVPAEDVTVVYTLRFPHQTTWNAETALHFVNQLTFSLPQLLLAISADSGEIRWQLLDTVYGIDPSMIEQLIRASYPDAEVEVDLLKPPEVSAPFSRYVGYYRQVNLFVAPIAYVNSFKQFDPLNALTQAMSGLQTGERATFMLALAGHAQDAYKQGERLITQSTIHPLQFLVQGGIADAAGKMISGRDRMDKYEYRDQKALEDKLREKLYYAYLWLQVDAPEVERVASILALLDAQVEHFTRMPFNSLSWVERPPQSYARTVDTADRERETNVLTLYRRIMAGELKASGSAPPFLILEPREIAALWHPPAAEFSAPRIGWASGLKDVPEAVARLDDGVILGIGKYQGRDMTVNVPHADRVTHLNVVGRTGTGKSTLLQFLIEQDIARGAGVAVIDPHGKLVKDILRGSALANREADVVVLDIANEQYPPPLNPLNSVQGYTSTLRVVGVIERLFAGTEGAARMASYLRAALIPLVNEPQATMRDVTRMVMDDVYREQRLQATDDPETLDFWDYQYNHSSPALQRQIAEPIINRIRPFYANPYLYPTLCHSDPLDLHALIRQKKIILISLALDEERVPEQERNLIGALLMSQLQMSGMKVQPEQPFYVYVDEVQRFVTTSLSEMLSEARKYGLSLTTANQYLGQLTGKTLEAVMGNVGTTVIFQCSPDDARDLSAYTKPQFDAPALVQLDRYQAVVKMQVHGQTQPAFNVLTLPPPDVPVDALAREQRIRQQSIAHYTPKCREDVLAWLKTRYPRRRSPASGETATDEATFYDEGTVY